MARLVLLVLVFLTASFYRSFAHIGITLSGTKVYVTELALGTICLLLVLEAVRRGEVRVRYGLLAVPVLMFITWGLVCALRGHKDGIRTVRDLATNYYSIFYLLVPLICTRIRHVKHFAFAILFGTVVAGCIGLLNVATGHASITSTGVLRFHPTLGIGGSFAFFYLIATPAKAPLHKILRTVLAGLVAMGVILATQHRSAALALLVALMTWVLFLHRQRAAGSVGNPLPMVLLGCMAIGGIALLGNLGAATIERLFHSSPSTGDYNALWRLHVWSQLVRGFLDSPLIGQGFGANTPYFVYRGLLYGDDPSVGVGAHNSYLFIAYKEGLIGLLCVVVFGLLFLYRSASVRLESEPSHDTALGAAFSASFVFVAVYAMFNVVLEGPYMGMFFWLYPGLAEASYRLSNVGSAGV